ncbi:hypothetical protein [Streptomyces sp. NBC_01506]|uniref:hypothetical protein n=1 Tax=Streptomyces sp. NBC_01506 TaxID=2903887 RepID=UPI0038640510
MPELTEREERRLRAALELIGDAAAHPDPVRPVRRAPLARRRHRRLALAGAALLGAAALCTVLLTNVVGSGERAEEGSGRGSGSGSGIGQTAAEGIACARLIAEGDVLDVRPAPQTGRVLLTFAVDDWIKPAKGADTVELNLVDPAVAQVAEPFRKGQRLLLVVPVRDDLEANASSGTELTRYRAVIEDNWAKASTTECPPYWKGTGPEPHA